MDKEHLWKSGPVGLFLCSGVGRAPCVLPCVPSKGWKGNVVGGHSHQSTATHRSTKRMIALLGTICLAFKDRPTTCLTRSVNLLFFNRRRRWRLSWRGGRWSQVEREVSCWLSQVHRYFLRVGLLLVLDTRPGDYWAHCIWSVYGTVHYTVHCRQHTIHGYGPSRHGSRFWKYSPVRKLCEFCNFDCNLLTLSMCLFFFCR